MNLLPFLLSFVMIDFEKLRTLYERERSIYLKSHQNPWNRRLHQITVSMEWLAAFVLIATVNPILSFLVALGTAIYLAICSHELTSRLVALWTLLVAECASIIVTSVVASTTEAVVLAGVLQAVAWAVQVPLGHWLIEKNSPSMATHFTLNSVVLSLLLAFHNVRDSSLV